MDVEPIKLFALYTGSGSLCDTMQAKWLVGRVTHRSSSDETKLDSTQQCSLCSKKDNE